MERAQGLLLDEEGCSQLGEHQRAEFVFRWLTHLKKQLPATDRVRCSSRSLGIKPTTLKSFVSNCVSLFRPTSNSTSVVWPTSCRAF